MEKETMKGGKFVIDYDTGDCVFFLPCPFFHSPEKDLNY